MADTATATLTSRIPIVEYLVLDAGEPHLTAKQCTDCNATYFDRRNACARCGAKGDRFTTTALATTGKVRGYTIVKRAAPGVPTPYVSAVIDLDGGGAVKANVVDLDGEPIPQGNVTLGMPVRLVTFPVGTDDEGTEAIAFGFAPHAGQEATKQ